MSKAQEIKDNIKFYMMISFIACVIVILNDLGWLRGGIYYSLLEFLWVAFFAFIFSLIMGFVGAAIFEVLSGFIQQDARMRMQTDESLGIGVRKVYVAVGIAYLLVFTIGAFFLARWIFGLLFS